MSRAIFTYVIYEQRDTKEGLVSHRDDGTKLVPKNCEKHTLDGIAGLTDSFAQDMIGRGVTLSAMSRPRASDADVFARPIQSAHSDPQHEGPASQ